MVEEFSGEAAEFEVVDGIMRCSWRDERPALCIPLRIFRINLDRANRTVAEHDARAAVILPMRNTGLRMGKRRGHAASDS